MGDGTIYTGLDNNSTKYQTNSLIKHFAISSTHIIVIHSEVTI